MVSRYSWILVVLALVLGAVARAEDPQGPDVIPALSPENLLDSPKDVVTELILDASGSMKASIGQRTKLYQAKRVLRAFMEQAHEDNMVLGLRVYGTQPKDCKDSKLMLKFGEKGSSAIESAIERIDPKGYGKTPLAYSLQKASEDLRAHKNKPKRIILVTDGAETCGGDPCKIAEQLKREHDIRIYVVGYALTPDDAERLRCLSGVTGGRFFDAFDINSLLNALKGLANPHKNLIVKSPDPLGMSEVWELRPEKKPLKVGQFVSSLGTHVEPNKSYMVRVLLNPWYEFQRVVVAPHEVKVLEVKGTGTVTINFSDQLFAVTVLNEAGAPVMSFPSDVPTQVPAGFYKIQAVSPPFAEAIIADITVAPNGIYEENIKGFGGLQLENTDLQGTLPIGYYVFDDQKKLDLGSYLTNTPLVLPLGRYLIKTAGNSILKNVYPEDRTIRRIPVPPPGRTVTFTRLEKADPSEKRGPKMLDDLTAEEIQRHLEQGDKK